MISIIIPLYNAQEYLRGLIDNLIENTSYNDEVVFVDDGSEDLTRTILSELVNLLKCNYKILVQKNSGQSSARNCGFKVATNDLVCFMDADDLLDNQFNTIKTEIKNKNDVDFFVFNFLVLKHTDSLKKKESHYLIDFLDINQFDKKRFMNAFLSKSIKIHNSAIIYRKDFLVKNNIIFDESLRFGEDSIFIWESIIKSNLFTYSKTVMYYYLDRPSSVIKSSNIDKINCFNKNLSLKLNENPELITQNLVIKITSNYLLSSVRTIARYDNKIIFNKFLVDNNIINLKLDEVFGKRFILLLFLIKVLGENSHFIVRYL